MNSKELLDITEEHYAKGSFSETIRYARQLVEQAEQDNAPHAKFRALILWGNAQSFMAEYLSAIECFQQAYDFALSLDDAHSISSALNAFGYMYLSIGEFAKAKSNLRNAMALLGDKSELDGIILLNLSIVELHEGNVQEALRLVNTAIEILSAKGVQRSLGYALINQSKISIRLGYTTDALNSMTKAESLFSSIQDKLGLGQVYILLGTIFSTDGWDSLDYQTAEKHLAKALEYLKEVGAKKHISDAHKAFSTLYEKQKLWENCWLHLKQASALDSEVQTAEAQKKTALLEAELSMTILKNEAEIKHLRNVELQELNEKLHKALHDLKEGERQLIQSEKMASLGQLTAGIAHELNNPIGFISSSISPLRRDIEYILSTFATDSNNELLNEFKEETENLLRAIEEGAKRTSDIVKGLRTFARLDEHEFKLTNIHEGIDATLILLRSMLGNTINVQKNYGNIPNISCLAGPINQVFMNILVNAIQAIRGNGTITITTAQQENKVVVRIKDTGTGMSSEVINRIFEPFYTTKPVGEGTGLGLSICYDIVRNHKGDITITSELGHGTECTIVLPLLQ